MVVVSRSTLLPKRYGEREDGQAVILKGKSNRTQKLRRRTQPSCVRGRHVVELQLNVLNHANFENPRNATVGSPAIATSSRQNDNFGLVCCSTAALASSANVNALGEPNRVMQFGVKLNF